MTAKRLGIATRGSALALWQARHVKARLEALDAALAIELVVLKTRGDTILERALSEVGGKGLFVKEIEEALLDGRADIAVHSMKDLPAELADGLMLAAVPEREDARDALVVRPGLGARSLMELLPGARVGTSSLRRACQIRAARADLHLVPLRGNVDTRLRRLDAGELDAIVLACAGLRRLGFAARITRALDFSESLPAIGQGALALECRASDADTRARLEALAHLPTTLTVAAERSFLARLGGGCQTPMAAHAELVASRLELAALVGRPDGSELLHDHIAGPAHAGAELGRELAERLLARGADRILSECIASGPIGGA